MDRSENARSESLVRCFWCRQVHEADHPLSICPSCTDRFATRRSLGMDGPHPLEDAAIDEVLTRKAPGNFALGYMDGDGFHVSYVGRSDFDVRERLHGWVGVPSQYRRYASPAKASWALGHRGRSPLASPALGRVGNCESAYTRFAYSYASSAEAAFEKECRDYEELGGSRELDNAARPEPTPA